MFTSSLTCFSACPSPPISVFLFFMGAEGTCSIHLFSGSLVGCRFKARTAVVVVWTKCPALVTLTLKHLYLNKTSITSAGMSRQAMSTTATVGCLNSCYTRFHTISLSLCLVATLDCSLVVVAHLVFFAPASSSVFRANGKKYSCVWLITPNFHPNS